MQEVIGRLFAILLGLAESFAFLKTSEELVIVKFQSFILTSFVIIEEADEDRLRGSVSMMR